ncbi:MAG TPA: substrate-binding domain-containing protein [Vicinamibacterales bacterium]
MPLPSGTRGSGPGTHPTIGVVVESTEGPWFTQLLSGIEEALVASRGDLMLCSLTAAGHYDAAQAFRWIRERRVDGLLFASLTMRERSLLEAAVDVQMPLVVVSPDEPLPGHHVVRGDNRRAGMLVAHHLADLGHTRIAFAGGRFNSGDSQDRLRGLTEGLAARQRPLDPNRIHHCNSYYAEAGAAFARVFLQRPLDVTAIVLANDALALGFRRVALQRGIRIPEDLSIVGFDGVPEGDLVWPGLTTVAQPMQKMGQLATRTLLAEIESPGAVPRKTIELQMDLVRRESTGPARPLPRPRNGRIPGLETPRVQP